MQLSLSPVEKLRSWSRVAISDIFSGVNSKFRYTKSSLVDLMDWNPEDGMYLINQPLLMMAGGVADTFYMTERCFSKESGTSNKEMLIIPGARNINTYYVPGYVEQVVGKPTDFFDKNL